MFHMTQNVDLKPKTAKDTEHFSLRGCPLNYHLNTVAF